MYEEMFSGKDAFEYIFFSIIVGCFLIMVLLFADSIIVRSEDVGDSFDVEIIRVTIIQNENGDENGYILSYSENGEVRTVYTNHVSIGNESVAELIHQEKNHIWPIPNENGMRVISATVTEELYSGMSQN